jgi:hypothetical protein
MKVTLEIPDEKYGFLQGLQKKGSLEEYLQGVILTHIKNIGGNKLFRSLFRVDGDAHFGYAFTDGTTWNGWAKPKFTKPSITSYLSKNGWNYEFHKEKLTIFTEEGSEDYSPMPYDTFVIGKCMLYELPGLCWVEKDF